MRGFHNEGRPPNVDRGWLRWIEGGQHEGLIIAFWIGFAILVAVLIVFFGR